MQNVNRVAAIAAFGVLLLLPSRTPAQQSQPQEQPSAQQPPAQKTDLNDNQLRSVAKVYVQIQKIRQTYEPQMKQAKSPDEGKRIQDEAVSKMRQALKQEGMDEQTYDHIIDIARNDEGVRKKLLGFINEEKQKS